MCFIYGYSRSVLSFERAARLNQKIVITSNAATLHCRRVYHQVQAWLCKKNWIQLHEDRIFMAHNRGLFSLMMDQNPVPAALLKVIWYNCYMVCDRNICGCRKNDSMHVGNAKVKHVVMLV